MTRLLRTSVALLVCVAALLVASPAPAGPSFNERRIIAKINHIRADHGLRTLRVGPRLQRGAHGWARHLLRTDSFYHSRLAPRTGENIAWGTCSWFSPRESVRAWMRSSSHRALILDRRFRRIGAGWVRGSWSGHSCVEMAVVRFRY
jgi:uncharacterized protein YkwD